MSLSDFADAAVKTLPYATDLSAPYGKKELEDIRFRILVEMKSKGFKHYLEVMQRLKVQINEALKTGDMADDLWTRPGSVFSKESWWKKESPWLEKKLKKLYFRPSSGVLAPVKFLMNDELVKSIVGNVGWMTSQQKMLFRACIQKYFKNEETLWPVSLNMDLTYKTNKKNGKKSKYSVLESALSGSGPFILKILQQLNAGNESELPDGTKVADLTEKVFNEVPGMTPREYEFVKTSLNISETFKKNLNKKTIGSASIAEVHETFDEFSEKMIIKFMKPMYAYYFLCECNFFLTVSWKDIRRISREDEEANAETVMKQSRQLLLFFIREFISEFDYEQEAFNTIAGFKIYNKRNREVKSAQIRSFTVSPFPVIVQTAAPPCTLRKVLTEIDALPLAEKTIILGKVYASVIEFIEIWIGNLLWGTGFFHADAHLGNVMTEPLSVLRKKSKVRIWLIDYGSAGKLSKDDQCKLIDAILVTAKIKQMTEYLPKAGKNYTLEKYNDLKEIKELGKKEFDRGREIASFYRDTKVPSTQLILNLGNEKAFRKHESNVKTARKFVQAIWDICKVKQKERSAKQLDYLSKKILNYSEEVSFGTLFLNIIEYGSDIGECTTNVTLMFGRGIAYISDTIMTIFKMCKPGDVSQKICREWDIADTIEKFIIRNPRQIKNFLLNFPVCT